MDNEQAYLTPAGYGEALLQEKRSRFIARVWPVCTEEEAQAHIALMRERHWDANHNVYAYSVKDGGLVRYSDDGEPQGTSGLPVLGVFQGEGVQNVCCVVTRYFGGILLGSGGLVRAYAKAAKMALAEGGICSMRQWNVVSLLCPYALFAHVKSGVACCGGVLEKTEFGGEVCMTCLIPVSVWSDFTRQLAEMSAGTLEPVAVETVFRGAAIA